MKLATEIDLQCKHCGYKKSKLDLYSYFKWDDAKWSDKRELAPDQAFPAPVQFCPNCRHFYYIDAESVIIKDVDDYNWIEPLSYDKILLSVRDWFYFDWSPQIELKLRLLFLWTFNDNFYRVSTEQKPTGTEITAYKWNLLRLLKLFSDPIMKAEVLREEGMFEISLKIAQKAEVEDGRKHILEKIQTLAQAGDSKPFKIED